MSNVFDIYILVCGEESTHMCFHINEITGSIVNKEVRGVISIASARRALYIYISVKIFVGHRSQPA